MNIPHLPSIASLSSTDGKTISKGEAGEKSEDTGDIAQFEALFEALGAAVAPMQLTEVAVAGGKVEAAMTGKTGKKLPVELPVAPEAASTAPANAKDLWAILAESSKFLPVSGGTDVAADASKASLSAATIVKNPAAQTSTQFYEQVIETALAVITSEEDGRATIHFRNGGKGLSGEDVDEVVGKALDMIERKAAGTSQSAKVLPVTQELASRGNVGETSPQPKLMNPELADEAVLGSDDKTARLACSKMADQSIKAGPDTSAVPRLGADIQMQAILAVPTNAKASAEQPSPASLVSSQRIESFQGSQRLDELVQAISHARETATGAPVRAAVSHTEFGVIALKLAQDDSGLSARISSADAGFAPAAQAAVRSISEASSGNTNARGDEHARQHSGEQEAQQQHAGTSSQQSFSQGQSRAQADGRAETGNGRFEAEHDFAAEEPERSAKSKPDTNGGLYA